VVMFLLLLSCCLVSCNPSSLPSLPYYVVPVALRKLPDARIHASHRHQMQLITAKPVLYVCNLSESEAASGNALSQQVMAMAAAQGAPVVTIAAAIESEIAQLSSVEEQEMFLAEIGLQEPGLNRLVQSGYRLLGLQTFFTVGPKETRAWTIPIGARAPQAAGVIHTDFERGFIAAETVSYDDYIACGGEAGAKAAGKWRTEGKDYVVQDGDILLFRFNV